MDNAIIKTVTTLQNYDIEMLVAEAIPWIHEAGNPYYDWFFGSNKNASKVLNLWINRSSSEISIQKVRFIICENIISGGYIALSGKQLKHCRKSDTLELLKNIKGEKRSELMQRLSTASKLFLPVDDNEYYLSKMGINVKWRGKGLGKILIEQYLEEGELQNFQRYRLDVYAGNSVAVHCYARYGFEIDTKLESEDGSMAYYSMKYERR